MNVYVIRNSEAVQSAEINTQSIEVSNIPEEYQDVEVSSDEAIQLIHALEEFDK